MKLPLVKWRGLISPCDLHDPPDTSALHKPLVGYHHSPQCSNMNDKRQYSNSNARCHAARIQIVHMSWSKATAGEQLKRRGREPEHDYLQEEIEMAYAMHIKKVVEHALCRVSAGQGSQSIS
jgi:hypothetical protein